MILVFPIRRYEKRMNSQQKRDKLCRDLERLKEDELKLGKMLELMKDCRRQLALEEWGILVSSHFGLMWLFSLTTSYSLRRI